MVPQVLKHEEVSYYVLLITLMDPNLRFLGKKNEEMHWQSGASFGECLGSGAISPTKTLITPLTV